MQAGVSARERGGAPIQTAKSAAWIHNSLDDRHSFRIACNHSRRADFSHERARQDALGVVFKNSEV